MIETVLGPIPAERLGVTSMHDHVLSDASALRRDGSAPGPSGDRVGPGTIGHLRLNMLALADNLRLDEPDVAVTELAAAVALGQRSLVEDTSWGLGPDHAGLPDVARRSGMTIVCAYGAYIRATLPAWIAELDEDGLERHLAGALLDRVPGTGYRAGILGIMGTTADLPEAERSMLRSAARAAIRAGAAVAVRLDPGATRGPEVLALCAAEGLPAERVVLTNADEYMDAAYWADLAAEGAVLEMCFGTEDSHVGRVHNPSDAQRLEFFARFCAAHPRARHVLGGSLWTKAQLRTHGGHGYGHLMARIAPALRERGIPAGRLTGMLVDEPRRLLDRGEGAP
ncbi:phosphotriesterase [Streptomyces sp. PT12]|uniref:phosphotriesterase family protein n=1 Tax=Streptomyces sp. PT12 TaxID=1510197 RepID=UPI000DE31728|nr:phosphotriesterase [Streptomyces sp. PT12]RBM06285.1 phosphotriesterase [Streptomyces sp. PT12]